MARFVIRGTRGTMPRCEAAYLAYGGNTTCFSVHTDSGVIVVDAGTGLCHVGRELTAASAPLPVTMLFSHFHMDHLIGLPGFELLYRRDATITIMADPRRAGWRDTLRTFMAKPYWPVGLRECDSVMHFTDLPAHEGGMELYGVKVSWRAVPHPQGCLAFRFDTASGARVVFATDVEYTEDRIDAGFLEFCRDAGVLVMDAQYTAEEYPSHATWGHSTWEAATRAASAAGVKRLVLTHHDPNRKDADNRRILDRARAVFARTEMASENLVVQDDGR